MFSVRRTVRDLPVSLLYRLLNTTWLGVLIFTGFDFTHHGNRWSCKFYFMRAPILVLSYDFEYKNGKFTYKGYRMCPYPAASWTDMARFAWLLLTGRKVP